MGRTVVQAKREVIAVPKDGVRQYEKPKLLIHLALARRFYSKVEFCTVQECAAKILIFPAKKEMSRLPKKYLSLEIFYVQLRKSSRQTCYTPATFVKVARATQIYLQFKNHTINS